MAKILATEIRAGNLLEWDKRLWRVLKSYHVHVGGRGGAYMQIEIKDIQSGQKRNERLSTDEKIERSARHHAAFGYGPHQCIGQNLARMELDIALTSIFTRIPSLALATPLADLPFKHDVGVYGVHHLPVSW